MNASSIVDGLKGKWYAFSDWCESRRMPWLKFVLPLILVAVILFGGYSMLAGPTLGTLSVSVSDQAGNPVDGAKVMFLVEGKLLATAVSVNGIAKFKNVPKGVKATIKVSAEGFEAKSVEIVVGDTYKISLQSVSEQKLTESFVVTVLDNYGVPVSNAVVSATYGGKTESIKTDAFGSATVEIAPTGESIEILVKHPNYVEKRELHFLSEGSVSITTQAAQLQFAEESDKGSVSVRVNTQAEVFVYDAETDILLRQQKTGSDGIALIQNLGVGTKFYVNVLAEGYLAYNGKSDPKTVKTDKTTIEIKMEKATDGNSGVIKVNVVDENGAGYASANVILFGTDGSKIESKKSDKNGVVNFKASMGSNYYIAVAPKKGYLPALIESVATGDVKDVTLEKAVIGNYGSVKVHLTYREMEMAGVLVSVYNGDGYNLGVEAATKSNGVADFPELPFDSVYVVASYRSKTTTSDKFVVTENMTVDMVLNDPTVKIQAKITDKETKKGIDAAEVNAFNENEEGAGSCTTDATGVCTIEVPEDSKISLFVTASEYIEYNSELIDATEGSVIGAALVPERIGRELNVSFMGMFKGGCNPSKRMGTVEPGLTYDACFRVSFPSGTNYSGVYIRVGGEGIASENNAVILQNIRKKPSYSSLNYSPDYIPGGNCTTKEAEELKWVEIKFRKGITGDELVSLPVKVSTNVNEGEEIEFFTRVYAETKSGTLFSVPESETNNCFAETRMESVLVGPSQLECSDEACISLYFEQDNRKGSTNFKAFLGKPITGNFEVIYDGEAKQNLVLNLTVDNPYLNLSRASVTINGNPIPATVSNGIYAIVPSIAKGDTISGEFTALPTRTTQDIGLEIVFGTEEAEVVSKSANVIVSGTETFVVSVAPTSATANVNKLLNVTVKDQFGNVVDDAEVTLFDDETYSPGCEGIPLGGIGKTIVAEYNTTSKKYIAEVKAASRGKIGVRASKEGFNDSVSCPIEVSVDNMVNITTSTTNFVGEIFGKYSAGKTVAQKVGEKVTVQNVIADTIDVTVSISCQNTNLKGILTPSSFANLTGGVSGVGGGSVGVADVIINATNNQGSTALQPDTITKRITGNCVLTATSAMGTIRLSKSVTLNVDLYVSHGCDDTSKMFNCTGSHPQWCGPGGSVINNCSACGCPTGDECDSEPTSDSYGECIGMLSLFKDFPKNGIDLEVSELFPGDYYKFPAKIDLSKLPHTESGMGDIQCSFGGSTQFTSLFERGTCGEVVEGTLDSYLVYLTLAADKIKGCSNGPCVSAGNLSFSNKNSINGTVNFSFSRAPGIFYPVTVTIRVTHVPEVVTLAPDTLVFKKIKDVAWVKKPIFVVNNIPVTGLGFVDSKGVALVGPGATNVGVRFTNGAGSTRFDISQGSSSYDSSKRLYPRVEIKSTVNLNRVCDTAATADDEICLLYKKDAIDGVKYDDEDVEWRSCADDYCTCEPAKAALDAFVEKFRSDIDDYVVSRTRTSADAIFGSTNASTIYKNSVSSTGIFSEVMVFKIANLPSDCSLLDDLTTAIDYADTASETAMDALSGKIKIFRLQVDLADLDDPSKNIYNEIKIKVEDFPATTGLDNQWAIAGTDEKAEAGGKTIYSFAQKYTPDTMCVVGDVATEILTNLNIPADNIVGTKQKTDTQKPQNCSVNIDYTVVDDDPNSQAGIDICDGKNIFSSQWYLETKTMITEVKNPPAAPGVTCLRTANCDYAYIYPVSLSQVSSYRQATKTENLWQTGIISVLEFIPIVGGVAAAYSCYTNIYADADCRLPEDEWKADTGDNVELGFDIASCVIEVGASLVGAGATVKAAGSASKAIKGVNWVTKNGYRIARTVWTVAEGVGQGIGNSLEQFESVNPSGLAVIESLESEDSYSIMIKPGMYIDETKREVSGEIGEKVTTAVDIYYMPYDQLKDKLNSYFTMASGDYEQTDKLDIDIEDAKVVKTVSGSKLSLYYIIAEITTEQESECKGEINDASTNIASNWTEIKKYDCGSDTTCSDTKSAVDTIVTGTGCTGTISNYTTCQRNVVKAGSKVGGFCRAYISESDSKRTNCDYISQNMGDMTSCIPKIDRSVYNKFKDTDEHYIKINAECAEDSSCDVEVSDAMPPGFKWSYTRSS